MGRNNGTGALYIGIVLLLKNGFFTLSQTTNFRLFQTERIADDEFRFDEN